jgi:hypothetical protein
MKSLIITMLVGLACFGCGAPESSLVGTYLVDDGGTLKEFIRIEKQGDAFTVSENQDGKWSPPEVAKPVSKEDFQSLTKESVTVDFSGLSSGGAAIFQVPKGWRSGEFECKTGYFLATLLGPVELHKQ